MQDDIVIRRGPAENVEKLARGWFAHNGARPAKKLACALLARLSRSDLSTERASSVYVSLALL